MLQLKSGRPLRFAVVAVLAGQGLLIVPSYAQDTLPSPTQQPLRIDATQQADAVEAPLQALVRSVLAQNSALRADEASLEAARAAMRAARAAGLPQVTISGSIAEAAGSFDLGESGSAAFDSLFGAGDTAGAGGFDDLGAVSTRRAQLSVTQPVFTGFQIRNSIAEARALLDAATADLAAVRQATAFQIAQAYLGILTAEERVRVVVTSVERLTQQARAAQVSFEAGQLTRTDVALAEARLSATRADLARARADAISARNAFAALGGTDVPLLDLEAAVLAVPDDPEVVVRRALSQNPQIAVAQAALAAREAARRAAQGARAPQVQLRGSLVYGENVFLPGDQQENAQIVAEASLPVFRGGATTAQIARARADENASRFVLSDVQGQIEAEARSAFASYQASLLSREAALRQVEAAALAYRGVSLERELGQRTILDVLQVEEDLQAARFAALNSRQEVVLASYRVRRAMGDLLKENF